MVSVSSCAFVGLRVLTGCQSGAKKLKETQIDSVGQPQPKKKRRSPHQHETQEAEALSTVDETSAAVGTHKKKDRNQISPDEAEEGEQRETEQNTPTGHKAKKNGGALFPCEWIGPADRSLPISVEVHAAVQFAPALLITLLSCLFGGHACLRT